MCNCTRRVPNSLVGGRLEQFSSEHFDIHSIIGSFGIEVDPARLALSYLTRPDICFPEVALAPPPTRLSVNAKELKRQVYSKEDHFLCRMHRICWNQKDVDEQGTRSGNRNSERVKRFRTKARCLWCLQQAWSQCTNLLRGCKICLNHLFPR